MEPHETVSAITPLLRNRALRVLLLAGPGITASVAVLSAASGAPLAAIVAINVATGLLISGVLFVAASMQAHRVAGDRESLAKAAEEGQWRARMRSLSIRNEETGLYSDWYFRLRLQEEIDRSARYEVPFTLVLGKPSFIHNELDARATSGLFYDRVRKLVRHTDLPAILKDGTLAILLPHTRDGAVVQQRLESSLASSNLETGSASYPAAGADAEALLLAATRDANRNGSPGQTPPRVAS
ncbi:MAG: hypothetical protein WEB04_01755 [Dehalococcoidia bacterium]